MTVNRIETFQKESQKYKGLLTGNLAKLRRDRAMVVTLRKVLLGLFLSIGIFSTSAQIGPTPAAERIKNLEKRKLAEQKSLLKDISFRSVGPAVMSGRVSDVDVNENDPTEFYVAYSTGG